MIVGLKAVVTLAFLVVTFALLAAYFLTDTGTLSHAYSLLTSKDRCKYHTGKLKYLTSDSFLPVSEDGVYTFHGLCIERQDHGSEKGRRLIVYNARYNETRHLAVRSGPYIRHPYWIIDFTTVPIPSQHKVLTNAPAFFVQGTCEGNLHHFWEDLMLGLYGTLKETHWLGKPSVVYTSSPAMSRDNHCHDPNRFHPFLSVLGVMRTVTWYQHETHGLCYENAVFGSVFKNIESRELENFITLKLNITQHCPPNLITIVQRSKSRVIKNVDQLRQLTLKLDPAYNVNITTLETMSLHEQVQLAACTKVLVGVQGAGLQWYTFMSPPAGLVEITWTNWPALYSKLAEKKCYVTRYSVAEPTVNWRLYEEHFHLKPLTDGEREYEINRSPNIHFFDNHNVWKWADVNVSGIHFEQHIKYVLDELDKI